MRVCSAIGSDSHWTRIWKIIIREVVELRHGNPNHSSTSADKRLFLQVGPSRPCEITSWGIIDQGIYALNPNHRRSTMKVTQAVDFHLQYHRANSKKKYCQNQWVCPQQVCSKFLRSWTGQYITGGSFGFSAETDQGQQAGDKKESLFGPFCILQLQHQYRLTIPIQPLQYPSHQENLQTSTSNSMADRW